MHYTLFKFNWTFALREIIALDSIFTAVIVLVKGQQSHVFEKILLLFQQSRVSRSLFYWQLGGNYTLIQKTVLPWRQIT